MNIYIHTAALLVVVVALLLASVPAGTAVHAQADEGFGVAPPEGAAGTTFTFFYDDWGADERIDYWIIGPGSARPFEIGDFSSAPDANGRTTWTWTAPEGVWSGVWTMNARSVDSYEAVQIPFVLNVDEEPFPAYGVGPERGTPGTRFDFFFDGWPRGDVVDFWVLAPGQEEPYFLGRIYGDEGRTEWHWIAPDDVWGGVWIMGAHGYFSEASVQIPFYIDGPDPPPPPTASVSTTEAVPGQTLTFTANGYKGGEEIAFWVNAPGVVDPVFANGDDELYANLDGEVTFSWTLPDDAPVGVWSVAVLGRSTYTEHQIVFSVVAPGEPAALPYQVEPANGPPGTTFTFTASTFKNEEPIGYWATGPEGQTRSSDDGLWADETGNVVLTWATSPEAMSGEWVMTLQGKNSLKTFNIPFRIGGASSGAVSPSEGVSPVEGAPGTTFHFFVEGYMPREQAGWWPTSPTGELLPGGIDVKVDETGRLDWTWTAPPNVVPGRWMMVVQGKESNRESRLFFEIVTDEVPPPPSPPYSVTPASAPPGTTFTFTAEVEPTEQLGYWATDPRGTVYPGSSEINADDEGLLTWTWTAPEDALVGPWMMTVQSSISDEVVANTWLTIPFAIEAP